MLKTVSFLIVLLLLFLLPACFYSDTEIYFVEPVPGDPANISVSTNLDSIYNPQVNDSLEVIYTVDIEGGELYYMYAGIGSTPIYESDSTFGSFWIQSRLKDTLSVDTLLMDFYYSSNSNSLADRVGYEALVESLKIAIAFDLLEAK